MTTTNLYFFLVRLWPTLTKMHLEGQECSIKFLMTTKYDNYQANPVKRKGMMWCTSNLRVSIWCNRIWRGMPGLTMTEQDPIWHNKIRNDSSGFSKSCSGLITVLSCLSVHWVESPLLNRGGSPRAAARRRAPPPAGRCTMLELDGR